MKRQYADKRKPTSASAALPLNAAEQRNYEKTKHVKHSKARFSASTVTRQVMSKCIVLTLLVAVLSTIKSFQIIPNQEEEAERITTAPPPKVRTTPQKIFQKDPVVGTFNGQEIVHRQLFDDDFHSSISCIGETFQKQDAVWPAPWLYRTCKFENLCFDVDAKEFVLFRSPADRALDEQLQLHDTLATVSTSFQSNIHDGGGGVAIGPISNRWKVQDKKRMKWFPKVIDDMEKELGGVSGYYELAGDTVMVPFHCMKGENLGHVLWDTYLPIYHILLLFDLLPTTKDDEAANDETNNSRRQLFLMRYLMQQDPPLWGSCEGEKGNMHKCEKFFNKTLPLMGIQPERMRTTKDSVLVLKDNNQKKPTSKYVCSPRAVAGMGLHSDHGLKLHGEWSSDYTNLHNFGRGNTLYDFRNFLMKNMGLALNQNIPASKKRKVVFSIHSSANKERNLDFGRQIAYLKAHLAEAGMKHIEIEVYAFADHTFKEQMEIISQASILITTNGGGAATSIFLPKGASLILFFNDKEKDRGGQYETKQRLDFDYFNNLGYIRSHWMPISSREQERDLKLFVSVIEKELRSTT